MRQQDSNLDASLGITVSTNHPFGSPRRLLSDWQFWLGLMVSLFFLYWAFRQVDDLGGVAAALRQANYWFVVPALAVYFLGVGFRALRWSVLLRPVKSLSTVRLFSVVVIGYMANDVLPARMGELVRAYILGRDEQISKGATIATIFVERVFDGLVMILFVAVIALFVPLGAAFQQLVGTAAALLIVIALVSLLVATSPVRASYVIGIVLRLAPNTARVRIRAIAERFLSGLSVLQNPSAMLTVGALTVVSWLCEATMYYILGLGFSLAAGFPAFLLTTAVANLGTMVPSSPGYVGTFEALSVFSLSRFGIESALALSYTVALHAVLLVPITLLGFVFMWRRHVSIRQIRSQ